MRRPGVLVLGVLLASPLLGQHPISATADPREIYLIGSAHGMHFEERYHYSLVDLQEEVRSLHPDLVCGEITPEAFNGPMEGNFPPEAAMLAVLAPSLGARFVPADWRVSFALQTQGGVQEAADKVKAAQVDAAQSKIKSYFDSFPCGSLYEYTNGSEQYQAMVDHMFEDVIGARACSR